MLILVVKALHISAVIFWLAALLYLPRLFVYHAEALAKIRTLDDGGEGADQEKDEEKLKAQKLKAQGQAEIFVIMEQRLLRAIATPAMGAALFLGLILTANLGAGAGLWFVLKVFLVLGLFIFHGLLAKWRKQFAQATAEPNKAQAPTEKFFRRINEIPAVLAVVIVLLVVLKIP